MAPTHTPLTLTVRVRRVGPALAYARLLGGLLVLAGAWAAVGGNPRRLLRAWDRLAPYTVRLLRIEQQTPRGWERI